LREREHMPLVLNTRASDPGQRVLVALLRGRGDGHVDGVLLTGDIERAQEAPLVAGQREALRSDVLIVSHHGSKTSSSAPFLDTVRPAVAVYQAGYRNRFGRSAAEVLERYRERGTAIVASRTCGAWLWRGDRPSGGSCQRETGRRCWHHPGLPIDP
jgi:competence protein ComEC